MKRARPDDNSNLSAAKKRKINPASSTSNKLSFYPSPISEGKQRMTASNGNTLLIHSSSSINNSSSSKGRTIKLNLRNKGNRNNTNSSNPNPNIPSLQRPSTHHSHTRFTRNSARDRAPNNSSRDHLQRTSRHSHNKSIPMNTIITKNSSSSSYPTQTLQHQQHRERPITSYPIYGQKQELQRCQELIKDLDDMINAIKQIQENEANDADIHQIHHAKNYKFPKLHNKQEPHCPRYKMAEKKLCEPQEGKLKLIREELKNTNGAYHSKYECKEYIIKNEYHDLVDRAKNKLKAKYQERKLKQERLFKTEFSKHQRKIEKARKKAMKLEMDKEKAVKTEKNGNVNGATNEKEKTPHLTDDVLFKKEKYPRYKMIENGNILYKKQWPSFMNQEMESKWRKISGIADRDMEADVNTMVADTTQQQQNGNHNKNKNRIRGGGGQLEIKDILAMFPKCDITYKSDKNVLTIQYEKKPKKKKKGTDDDDESSHSIKTENKPKMIVMHLKCGSYIATQQKRQSVMYGTIMSVSSKGIWARLRQQGAKNMNDSFLTEIKTSQIEEGSVKIKLIN